MHLATCPNRNLPTDSADEAADLKPFLPDLEAALDDERSGRTALAVSALARRKLHFPRPGGLEPGNLKKALARVRRNKGAPGVDGMSVDELGDHLRAHWPEIRSRLLAGSYTPQPVRRVEIPKASGGVRRLGVPTVIANCTSPPTSRRVD